MKKVISLCLVLLSFALVGERGSGRVDDEPQLNEWLTFKGKNLTNPHP